MQSRYEHNRLLEEIVQNTEPKSSTQIVVIDNSTKWKTTFNPPIQLDKNRNYEMALVNLETYWSFPNISESNNVFRYSPGFVEISESGRNNEDGSSQQRQWFEISLPNFSQLALSPALAAASESLLMHSSTEAFICAKLKHPAWKTLLSSVGWGANVGKRKAACCNFCFHMSQ